MYPICPTVKIPTGWTSSRQNNAARYGGNPSRIIVGGESAGGNLALALGVSACFERDEPAARMIWDTGVVPKNFMKLCGML